MSAPVARPPQGSRVTGVVLLAAGSGSRFTGPTHKLVAPLPGGGLVYEHALAAARASAVGPVLVVTGQARLTLPVGVLVVHNPAWSSGQASSLAAALQFAERAGWEAVLVGLADQPGILPAAWRAVAVSSAAIAVATYDGHRRNPVKLRRDVWSVLPGTGDEGARSLMRMRPELVEEVPCAGQPVDIDTVEDLDQWSS